MADEKKYAACQCGEEMVPGGCCVPKLIHLVDTEDFKVESYKKRVVYDGSLGPTCPDCNVGKGKTHHMNCDIERCPQCGNQLISCECWDYTCHNSVLKEST